MNTDFIDRLFACVALADAGLDHNRLDVVQRQINAMHALLAGELDRVELEEAQSWWLKQQEYENGTSDRSRD